jgi:ferredoxin
VVEVRDEGAPRNPPRPAIKVVADLDLCQGHQMCQGEAPEVFGFDKQADQVVLLEERPDEAMRPQVEAAVRYCPAMALSIAESIEEDA